MKNAVIFLFLISCSFRPQDKDKEIKSKETREYQSSSPDSDGDGVSDASEELAGSDPFIADIPVFEGDLFDEMKVEVEFYNNANREMTSINWIISEQKIKLSWEEEERRSPSGGTYMESLLKNYATGVNFKKNNFKFFDYNEGVFSYSSPVLLEETLFSISEKLMEIQRKGFEINRAQAVIKSKFQITSKKFTSFRNPIFDVYYKSKNREGLVFIESKRIDGTYSFNEENEIYVSFENFDPDIINEGLLSGGASFFLKLRDFTVYDTDKSYSSILASVQAASVPVTISYPESEKAQKSKVETIYVGIGGRASSLRAILKKGFKDALLMTETSIDQIRNLSNRQRSYGESGQNETLKWYVGSSEIEDNIYSYLFKPNQGIGLSYLSDKKTEKMPIYVSRASLTNGSIASSGNLPGETRGIKIKLVSQKILTPFEKVNRIIKSDCGRGNWQRNEVIYDQIQLDYKNDSHKISELAQRDLSLKISSPKGAILEGNLGQLIKGGHLEIIPSLKSTELEFTLSNRISKDILKERTQIKVELLLKPLTFTIRQGLTTKVSENCKKERMEPSNGADGGHFGGMNGIKRMRDFTGFGENGGEEEMQYDLNFHVFSY